MKYIIGTHITPKRLLFLSTLLNIVITSRNEERPLKTKIENLRVLYSNEKEKREFPLPRPRIVGEELKKNCRSLESTSSAQAEYNILGTGMVEETDYSVKAHLRNKLKGIGNQKLEYTIYTLNNTILNPSTFLIECSLTNRNKYSVLIMDGKQKKNYVLVEYPIIRNMDTEYDTYRDKEYSLLNPGYKYNLWREPNRPDIPKFYLFSFIDRQDSKIVIRVNLRKDKNERREAPQTEIVDINSPIFIWNDPENSNLVWVEFTNTETELQNRVQYEINSKELTGILKIITGGM